MADLRLDTRDEPADITAMCTVALAPFASVLIAAPASAPAPVPLPAPIPPGAASGPVEDIPGDTVLIRLGDADKITQRDFERYAFGVLPRAYDGLITKLTEERLFNLYLKDHPQLVSEKQVDDVVEKTRRKGETLEQLLKRVEERGMTVEEFRAGIRRSIAATAMKQEGARRGDDPEARKQLYGADPTAFNGTEVRARAISIPSLPYDTPEQRQAKRRILERLREGLVDGTITWDQALRESSTPLADTGGQMGVFTRHSMGDLITQVAFKLKPNEISPVFDADWSIMLLQVQERTDRNRPVDHPDTEREIKLWLTALPLYEAALESRKKYPVTGVRPPARTPFMASKERLPETRPAAGGFRLPTGRGTQPAAPR